MKTAISIPNDLFKKAEKAAKRKGISRSKFYSKAVEVYLEDFHASNITAILDEVYAHESSRLDRAFARMQNRSIPAETW